MHVILTILSEYLCLCRNPTLTHLLPWTWWKPCLSTQALCVRSWATALPWRKFFSPLLPIPSARSLYLINPHRHSTTQSSSESMMRTKHPHSWLHSWKSCKMKWLGFHGENITDTWFTGPTADWNNQALKLTNQFWNIQNHPLKPLKLESKRQAGKFDKGLCISKTSSSMQCEFDFPLPLSPKIASNPVSILEFFKPGSKHQSAPTPATQTPATIPPNTNPVATQPRTKPVVFISLSEPQ